jgi:hypothetical protein
MRLTDSEGRSYDISDAYRAVLRASLLLARPGVILTQEQRDEIKRLRETPPSWPVDEKEGASE